MSAIFQPLWRIRRLLGWDSVPQSKAVAPTAPIPQPSQPTMKKPPVPPPIKTYGSGREPQGTVYNNIPISKERIQEAVQEAKFEALEHEKEVAPVKSYAYAGSGPNGLGLLDQAFLRRTEAWEAEQAMKGRVKAGPSVFEILPNASTVGVKTYHN